MALINPNNTASATGRLARDPKVFENKDGSKSVRFTLMIDDVTAGKDGKYGARGLDFQAFVPADRGMGAYGIIKKGMMVHVTSEPQVNRYTDKNGVEHFDIVLQVRDVRILETRGTTAAREAAKAQANGVPEQDEPVAEEPVAEGAIDINDLI